MFIHSQLGALAEPLTGRTWDRATVYRELNHRIATFQGQKLAPSDRVFIHYGNTLEFFVDLLSVWCLGGCAIPMDPRLTPFEIEHLARAATPRFSLWLGKPDAASEAVLASQNVKVLESPPLLRPGDSVHPAPFSTSLVALDDPALVLFTSGTTGQPKGVVHTHRSLRARWMALLHNLGTQAYANTLCLLPTHFGHGLICNCLYPWFSGQNLSIVPSSTEPVLHLGEILDHHEITFLSSVPSIWRMALKMAKPPRSGRLRRVSCGSAPLSAHLWKGIQEWSGTTDVMNAYGITETGSWTAGTTIPDFQPEDGLIGRPWGAVIKILKSPNTDEPPGTLAECAPGELGYIWLNTPALMKGYLGRDDLTRQVVARGWFVTGDLGLLDDRGYLYLRGRERDEINKGGMKVYPNDIDIVAEQFSATVDVCTFAFEDPLLGEDVGIALVLDPAGEETLRDLVLWLRERLAKHQMPQRWYILPEIPRTSRGKVNRSTVAESCLGLSPVDVRTILRDIGTTGTSGTT